MYTFIYLEYSYAFLGLSCFYHKQEKETHNIQGLLDSVTVDSKEGLKWLLGKPSSLNGYKILEVCHVRATTYKNRTLRLRVREADRFNERFRTREVERGVTLILQDINTKLQVNCFPFASLKPF